MDERQALGLTEVLLDRTWPGSVSVPYRKQSPVDSLGRPYPPGLRESNPALIDS